MNTAIISDRASNSGVGFAVPINTVLDLLDELCGGRVTRSSSACRSATCRATTNGCWTSTRRAV